MDVNSIHVEFETNMNSNDLKIECHLKGRDKVGCECYNVEEVVLVSHLILLSTCLGSNGVFTALGVSPGRHVIRVIARSISGRTIRKILKSIVYVPKDSESCRPHLINRRLNVIGNNATLEFSSTGSPHGFECILDRVSRGACKFRTTVHACTIAKPTSVYTHSNCR